MGRSGICMGKMQKGRSSAARWQQMRFSRALKQTSLVLSLPPRAAELGHCWRLLNAFAHRVGSSKRSIVVSMQLSEREELSSGLCSLVDALHLYKSFQGITSLGTTMFGSHDSLPPCVQRRWTPRPGDRKPLCKSGGWAGPPHLAPASRVWKGGLGRFRQETNIPTH